MEFVLYDGLGAFTVKIPDYNPKPEPFDFFGVEDLLAQFDEEDSLCVR